MLVLCKLVRFSCACCISLLLPCIYMHLFVPRLFECVTEIDNKINIAGELPGYSQAILLIHLPSGCYSPISQALLRCGIIML